MSVLVLPRLTRPAANWGVEYDRTPDPAWEEEVARIAPPSEHVSWLKLVWEPGDAWQPVGRWMLWHMLPAKAVRPDVLAELRGPNPRGSGHWCAPGWCPCDKPKQRWVGGPCALIDYRTWRLYQATGHYGRRWWTIQGTKGGHRHRLNPTESRVFAMQTGSQDTPRPGDLPYADFDQRTVRTVLSFDKVRLWTMVSEFSHRNADQLDAEERAEAEAANTALAGWIETQVEAGWDAYGSRFLRACQDAPVLPGVKDTTDYDAAAEQFIRDVAA